MPVTAPLYLLWGLLWASQTQAATVLGFDPSRERLLYGRAPFGKAEEAQGVAHTHGKLAADGERLVVREPPAYGEPLFWRDVELGSGLVRARLMVPPKSEASLILRLQVGEQPGDIEAGYAVNLGKHGVRIERINKGSWRPLGGEKRPLPTGVEVEIVTMLLGPWLSVDVFDGATLKPLAHLVAHDESFARGLIGVRLTGKASLGLLTAAPLSEAAKPPQVLDRSGAERVLAFSEAPELESGWSLGRAGNDSWVLVDPLERERLLRSGLIATQDTSVIPYKLLDPEMRRALIDKTGNSYKDADTVERLLRGYAEAYPTLTRLESIGQSHDGRQIWALLLSNNAAQDEDEPSVLFDGAHHSSELLSIEFVLDAIDTLLQGYGKDRLATQTLDTMSLWCVPLVNVDGNMRFIHRSREHVRKNGRDLNGDGRTEPWEGVDLYRNYPARFGALGEVGSRSWPPHWRYRGPGPGSEPEVQAMMRLAERERFVASIDFHTNATAILAPYTDPGMHSPEPNEAWAMAEIMAAAAPMQPNRRFYHVQRNLYPVDGTAQDWFRAHFGTVALLVEGPMHNPLPYATMRDKAVVATRPVWQTLLALVNAQPSVAGHVKDKAGRPVDARIRIDEQALGENEDWHNRPRDGRFQRFVAQGGSYTVRASAAGYREFSARLKVDGPKRLEVTMEKSEQ